MGISNNIKKNNIYGFSSKIIKKTSYKNDSIT